MISGAFNATSDAWIVPDWPAPLRVRALTTTRIGGVSGQPFDQLNLALHVGDEADAVNKNRQWLRHTLQLPEEPRWLNQVHGKQVVAAETVLSPIKADGSFTRFAGPVCAVLTADCLPIVLCDTSGASVAVLHGGWRGLAAGVVDAAIDALAPTGSEQLMAWLGPGIGPSAFLIGEEVRSTFVSQDQLAADAFTPAPSSGQWYGDLYMLTRQQLAARGVEHVYGGELCTCSDQRRFFSYRRDGNTGRMATLVWLQD